MTPLFRQKAVYLIERLIKDFPWQIEDACACVGNAGTESGGFKYMQEIHPVSGKGGYGFFQWTGPRRRAFEAWCKSAGLDINSDEANYGFLKHELQTAESATIGKVKAAKGLAAKTKAFEQAFERAGVKNYTSRIAYANDALQAWQERSQTPVQSIDGPAAPIQPAKPKPPPVKSVGLWGLILWLIEALFGPKK